MIDVDEAGEMGGSQFHLARKRNRWPETGAIGRETISLIWKTPSAIEFDKAGGNGWVAISPGRKTELMAENRNH